MQSPLSEEESTRILRALPAVAERAKRLPDVIEGASLFCNIRPVSLTDKAANTVGGQGPMFNGIATELTALTSWQQDEIKAAIMSFAQARDLKLGKVMQPIRAAVTGGAPSGDLVELLEILGQQEVVARLNDLTEA